MKKTIFGMLTAASAAVVSVVLVASSASAAAPPGPATPTTPYPAVTVNAQVCLAEAAIVLKAQNTYNAAVATYNRSLEAYNVGAGSLAELLNAQQAVDTAVIALNDANYAQATCQNKAVNPPPANANCITLILEFNRLTDDLVPTLDLQAILKSLADTAMNNYDLGVISKADYQAALLAYQNAQAQTKLVQAQIATAQKAATDAGCQNITRPAPAGGGPGGSPAPSSPAPSAPPSDAPSSPPPGSSTPAPSGMPS